MAGKGFAHVMGFDIASAWGTAVAAGAGDGIPFLSAPVAQDITLIPNNRITGTPFQGKGTKGTERYAGPVEVDVDAETVTRLLAVMLGTAGAPVQQGADLAYKHTLRVKASLEGIMATAVFGQASEFVREFTTIKINSVTLNATADGNLTASFEIVSQGRNDNKSSGTNTLTTLASITMPANSWIPTFNDLVVRINDQSGGALGGGDEVYVSEISLTINQNLKVDRFTTQHAPLISEPKRNGFPEITGSITLDEIDATTAYALIADARAKTVKKMDWTFSGPLAAGSTNYSLLVNFAGLQFENPDDAIDGPEIPDLVLPFRGSYASSAPTGMSFTDAVWFEIINQNSANPLTAT